MASSYVQSVTPLYERALRIQEEVLAAAKEASLGVVEALLRAHRDGATAKNADGCLPLHVAAEKAPVEVVEALLRAHPDGATATDTEDGKLPLHLAAEHRVALDQLRVKGVRHKA